VRPVRSNRLAGADACPVREPGNTKIELASYLDAIKSAIDAAARRANVSSGAWAQAGVPGTPDVGGVRAAWG
jgi:hypothetical protein